MLENLLKAETLPEVKSLIAGKNVSTVPIDEFRALISDKIFDNDIHKEMLEM